MCPMKTEFEITNENELIIGFKTLQPYGDIYCAESGVIAPQTSIGIYSGIKSITSENKNIIFYILGENISESNSFIETCSKFVGLEVPIYVQKVNHFHLEKNYKKDEFLAHIVPFKCFTGEFEVVANLDETTRSNKGFGSTGYK